MRPLTSFYLDGLRLLSAVAVFGYHAVLFWGGPASKALEPVGHGAVVVFFVLSGYLIAHARFSRQPRAWDFFTARVSRLYSVILPALVLSAVLLILGRLAAPEYYRGFERNHEFIRLLLCGLNVQNLWFFALAPATNSPFWSLSYEVFFYVMLGTATFGPRWSRSALTLLVAAVAGPPILLLLPCWLAGVAVYTLNRHEAGGSGIIGAVAGALAVAGTVTAVYVSPYPGMFGYAPLFFSAAFVSDFILAVATAASIVAVNALPPRVTVPGSLARGVQWGAARTFSLYLYHFPLLAFATAVWVRPGSPWIVHLAAAGVILLLIAGLSSVTEQRRRWIVHALNAARRLLPRYGGGIATKNA